MPQPAEIDVQAPIETLVKFVDARSLHRNQQDGTEDPKDELVVVQYAAGKMEPVCGKSPRHSLLISTGQGTKNPFFHGCCVYVHEKEELYVTSNLLQTSIASRLPLIIISQIKLKRSGDSERGPLRSLIFSKLRPPASMPMPAGACRFRDGVVYCAQGTPTPGSGGVYYMPMGHPPEQLVSSYYGTDFNSVQDVAAGSDGVLWFTDSDLGYQNDFRPPPQLPNRIYRYDATHGDLRAVAGDIANPSGLTVSKDQTRLYVSDYSARHSTGDLEPASPTGIYAYDIVGGFLTNRRLFACPKKGSARRLSVDSRGNVLAACGDGVEVWDPEGVLIGAFQVPGGASSFWISDAEMFICSEQRLWWIDFSRA